MRIIVLLLLITISNLALGFDQSGKFGIGGQIGYNAAFIDNDYQDSGIRDGDLTWGVYGRYNLNAYFGFDLGYSRYEIKETTVALDVYDLLGFYRFQGPENFSIIAGVGLGAAELVNYSPSILKTALKARVGVEYSFRENVSGQLKLDYQRVDGMASGDGTRQPGRDIHLLAPGVAITWYFGKP